MGLLLSACATEVIYASSSCFRDSAHCRQAGHVRLCKDCRAAERNFGKLQAFLSVASFVCLLVVALTPSLAAAATVSLPGGALRFAGVFGALAAVFAAAAAALSRFIFRSYHFEDFVHALND